MTDIEKKALALLNECAGQEVYGGWGTFDPNQSPCTRALCRAIEQHEAFRQKVSDAVEAVFAGYHDAPIPWVVMRGMLEPFIIPKPVDPLVEVLDKLGWSFDDTGPDMANDLRAAMLARGYEFTKIGEKV